MKGSKVPYELCKEILLSIMKTISKLKKELDKWFSLFYKT